MKKAVVFITLLCIVFLTACVTETSVESWVPSKPEPAKSSVSEAASEPTESLVANNDIHSSDISEVSEDLESIDKSDEVPIQHQIPEETKKFGDFEVITDTAKYEFFSESGTGSYYTEFHSANKDEHCITITLLDGRVMELNYTEIVFDKEDEIYRTDINGLDFMVSEFHDSNNTLCQVFECIEPMNNLGDFEGRVISTIIVKYKPELETGEINMTFLYEIKDGKAIIRYADGKEIYKTVLIDDESGKFYFG